MTLEKAVKNAAIRLLARREHSRREMIQKLSVRGFLYAQIVNVLDHLEQNNLLSETRFINCIVRVRSRCGYGPLKIFAELQKHEISQKRVMQDEDFLIIDWCHVAKKAKIKRFGTQKPQTYKEEIQQYRYLIGRGFLPEHIDLTIR